MIPVRSDADEVLQRTAVALWVKFSSFDPALEFLPWAKRFAFYEVLNFRKDKARERLIFSTPVLESLSATHDEMNQELANRKRALKTCLEKLKYSERELIQRRYADSQSIANLAQESTQTVKTLYRKLDRVRQRLAVCVLTKMAELKT